MFGSSSFRTGGGSARVFREIPKKLFCPPAKRRGSEGARILVDHSCLEPRGRLTFQSYNSRLSRFLL